MITASKGLHMWATCTRTAEGARRSEFTYDIDIGVRNEEGTSPTETRTRCKRGEINQGLFEFGELYWIFFEYVGKQAFVQQVLNGFQNLPEST